MRHRFSRRAFLATAAPALLSGAACPARADREPVDVELVLAVDVSRSVDATEQEMQFAGYANAFRDPRLIEGIAGGALGAIGVTLFTWSDWNIQEWLVPWARIDGRASAEAVAGTIEAAPRRTFLYTSISGAMDFAGRVLARSPFEGTRRVVDISGDGVNNSGRPVAEARAALLARGVVVNGLAVLDRTPMPSALLAGLPPLDEYYRDEVIGGPGSFLVVAEGFDAFGAAVRRKIIREIALAPPPAGSRVERVAA
jgi:hypothetical protein